MTHWTRRAIELKKLDYKDFCRDCKNLFKDCKDCEIEEVYTGCVYKNKEIKKQNK